MSIWGSLISGISSAVSMIPGIGAVAGPAIAGIGNALGGIVSGYESEQSAKNQLQQEQAFNAEQAQINRDFQREEREQTQQFNLDMWNMNNQYNSPIEQLKRGQEAGINPNDIINGMKGTSASAFQSTPMSGSQAQSPGSLASSILTKDLEMQKLLGQTRLVNAQATSAEIQNAYAPRLNDAALKRAEAEVNEIASRAGLNQEQANQIKEMLPLLKNKTNEEINKLKGEVNNLIKQGELLMSQKKKTDVETSNLEYDEARNQFEKEFRDKFGVAPGSGLVDGIIQLIGSGEKGANIASALMDTLFSVATGAIGNGISRLFGRKEGKKAQQKLYDIYNEGMIPTITMNPF